MIQIITGIRNIRGEMNISPSLALDVAVQSQDEKTRAILRQYKEMIISLARLKSFSAGLPGERPRSSATAVADNAAIFVSLEGIIDFAKETARLEKEIAKLNKELAAASKKLSNEDFLSKAPEDVVGKAGEKHALMVEKRQKLQTNLDRIKGIEK